MNHSYPRIYKRHFHHPEHRNYPMCGTGKNRMYQPTSCTDRYEDVSCAHCVRLYKKSHEEFLRLAGG
jgi:hypothetical protein